MVDPDVPRYAVLLKQHHLFQGLNEAQIAHVVNLLERVEANKGEVIYEQGERGESFYLIFRGRIRLRRREARRERVTGILSPGDHFGEDALLFDQPRAETAIAEEAVVLLRLDREAFFDLLQQFPEIRKNLSATAESRYLVRKENFDWMGEDEIIYLVARKHELFLFLALILPVLLFVASIPILVLSFSADSPFGAVAGLIGGILGMLIAILWGIWNWIDWGNDYYIVTSQRVVWLERVIIFYYSRREAPLVQVLAVNVSRSWLGRILGYGNVEVRTYTGGIQMRNMANPELFESFVKGYQFRAQRRKEEVEAQLREKELRRRLGLEKEEQLPAPAETSAPEQKAKAQVKPGSLREIVETFLKVRYERDNTITYRKHLLVLLRKVFLPSLAFLVLLALTALLVWRILIGAGLGMSLFPLAVLLFLLHVMVSMWWGYHYLDWNNDIYRLSPDQILDIERKPLGEEIKKSAPLDSILSLEHTREGILRLIFNYGDVIINVGHTQFIFYGVYAPDQVHKDIADYMEARRRRKEEEQLARERQRLGDWFGAYHQHLEELEETKKDSDWDLFPG